MKTALATLAATAAAVTLAAPASADENLVYCPSGYSAVATTDTSCAFADNVESAWYGQPGNPVYAWSPVTDLIYTMTCGPGRTDRWWEAKRCFGVNAYGHVLVVYID